MGTITLLSPLPVEECLSRLAEATDREGWLRFGSKPVIGRVAENIVRLRKRIVGHNSFQTYLVGSFDQNTSGTIFRGTAGMHSSVYIFMSIWFGFVALICIASLASLLQGAGPVKGRLLSIFIPPAMLIFGFGLIRFGRWMARGEDRYLVEFVANTIEAHEVAAAQNALNDLPAGRMP